MAGITGEVGEPLMEQVSFRLMKEKDIDQILIIERSSFATPWTRQAFMNELQSNHFAHYILLEWNGETIGYCGVWIIVDEAHITNIAILPEYRGKRLGEVLLRQVIDFAKGLGAQSITLEVRVSNKVAQNLYRKLGFQNGGIRKNYYVDNQEDALVMWVKIS